MSVGVGERDSETSIRLLLRRAVAAAILISLLVSAVPRHAAAAIPATVYFPVTGHNLSDQFLSYWRSHGDIAILGYPLSEPIERDGMTVQYFERARFELHPEFAGTPYLVELTLLGAQAVAGRADPPFVPLGGDPSAATSDRIYFAATGHYLAYGFKSYWEQNGGLPVFGYPLSEEFSEANPDTGQTYTVQYFERARFEYHPEFQGTPYQVELGRIGAVDAAHDGIDTSPAPRQDGAPDYDPALFNPHPASIHVPVLMYHRIGPNADRYVTPLPRFNQEMDWLTANGYHSITLAQLFDHVLDGTPLPANPVVITFDDASAGQWDAAAALDARGMHGTFFIPTGMSALSPDQLRSLQGRGHEIESHTISHPFLTQETDSQLRFELVQSKAWLESVLGRPVPYLAYPYGDFDARVMDAAAAAGYGGAVAAWGGEDWTPGKRYQEPRVEISGLVSVAQFAALVRQ